MGGLYAADLYSSSWVVGGAYTFHFSEDLGLEASVEFTRFRSAVTDAYERRYPEIQVIDNPDKPGRLYFGHLVWSFAYGKLRWMGDGISRFDFNLAIGAGATDDSTSLGVTGSAGLGHQVLFRQVVRRALRRARPRPAGGAGGRRAPCQRPRRHARRQRVHPVRRIKASWRRPASGAPSLHAEQARARGRNAGGGDADRDDRVRAAARRGPPHPAARPQAGGLRRQPGRRQVRRALPLRPARRPAAGAPADTGAGPAARRRRHGRRGQALAAQPRRQRVLRGGRGAADARLRPPADGHRRAPGPRGRRQRHALPLAHRDRARGHRRPRANRRPERLARRRRRVDVAGDVPPGRGDDRVRPRGRARATTP